MNICVITNLFPNKSEPSRATFNKQQIVALSRLQKLIVIAPVPMFKHSRDDIPYRERIESIEVAHPRYLVIPKTCRCTYGITFWLGIHNVLGRALRNFKADIILATWAYPDGVGSAIAALLFRKPLVIKVHGSDINVLAQFPLRRRMIRWACNRAKAVIAVSEALKQKLIEIGVDENRIELLSNGINTEDFHPMNKEDCRRQLGWDQNRKYILYAGNFVHVKGVDILLNAMRYIDPSIHLIMIGSGDMQLELEGIIQEYTLHERVQFLARQQHEDLPVFFNAADVFCLPSRNEGCPNVLLEAAACGVPAVSADVGGAPDIITSDTIGYLAKPEDPKDLAAQLTKALNRTWDPTLIRSSVLNRGWTENAKTLARILEKASQ